MAAKPLTPKCAALAEEWREAAWRDQESAETLRSSGRDWSSVYWHSGFAIEKMVKAVRVKKYDLEDWPASDQSARWHEISFVANRSSISAEISAESARDLAFSAYWLTVKDWDHRRRYPPNSPTEREARDLLTAVGNPTSGVMRWLLQIYHSI